MEREEKRYHEFAVSVDKAGSLYFKSKVSLDLFPEGRYPDHFFLDFPRFSRSFLPFPEGLDHETDNDLRYWQVEVDEDLPQPVRNEIINCFSALEEVMRKIEREDDHDFIILQPPLVNKSNSQRGVTNTNRWHPLTAEIIIKLFSLPQKENSLEEENPRQIPILVNSKRSRFLTPTILAREGIFFYLDENHNQYLSVIHQRLVRKWLLGS